MKSANKHLKTKINEISNFTGTHNDPPVDLYESFLLELKVSRLYLPGVYGKQKVDFEEFEADDGLTLLPLYTNHESYPGENELRDYPFEFYAELIADCGFDGTVINPGSDEMFVPCIITDALRAQPLSDAGDGKMYDAFELQEIAKKAKNERLLAFIQDETNFNDFDGLIGLLDDSVLLNVVSSRDDLEEHAVDGIISTLGVGGFSLSVKRSYNESYGLLFTSVERIAETCDTEAGLHYYCQVTSLDKILREMLANDLDGVIINPDVEEYYVPRSVLLDIYNNHPELIDNPNYYAGTFYAFTLNSIR